MAEKLPQSLRQRLVPLFKEILAYHWVEELTFNRLSGAVYQVLLSEENSRLTEDQAVDLAVNLTRRERLPELLARYDALVQKREQQAQKQVLGIVNNMLPEDTPNRAQVVQGTLDMLQKFPLVRSITGIRTLVQARIDNHHQDVDEDEYLALAEDGASTLEGWRRRLMRSGCQDTPPRSSAELGPLKGSTTP
jgi:hypothetical protein